jgi:enoyl-CoA hydratase/carnithine racemase
MDAPRDEPATGGLIDDLFDLGGVGLRVIALDAGDGTATPPGVVRVGLHRAGALPAAGLDSFDILLSAEPDAPRPWVGVADLDAALARLRDAVARQPVAAAVAAQVMRMTLSVSFDQALVLESLAYSMLLASEPFRRWRAGRPVRVRKDDGRPRVAISTTDSAIGLQLDRPDARNAVDAAMRDALVEALEFALADPDARPVTLTGAGPAFSAGGDLDEFGPFGDPGQAHAVRTLRSATGLAHRLGPRLTARLHGACVGAGMEVPAAAGRVTARPGAVFRLPEVSMGLIPGAGGTASIPRRIGRRRAAWMAIAGLDVDVATALAWGLVDDLEPAP